MSNSTPTHCRIVSPSELARARTEAAESNRRILHGVLLTAERAGDARKVAEISAELAVLDLDLPAPAAAAS